MKKIIFKVPQYMILRVNILVIVFAANTLIIREFAAYFFHSFILLSNIILFEFRFISPKFTIRASLFPDTFR